MPSDSSSDVKFEIGHVLFIDIVGYSKGLINEQSDLLQKLKEIVRGTDQFRAAEAEGKLLRLPTGDGGALVFRNSSEAPVLCAMEISKALPSHPQLRVRMGIHSGPVNEVSDLNEQANIVGAGINIAQRVMDCGDAGHILLSQRVADDLAQYRQWAPHLHDLGECEVKHGVRLHLVNLYTEELGNPEVPEKLWQAKGQTAPGAAASDALTRHDEGFWVAVLPFKYSGAKAELVALSEGLTEEIVTGLSRFSYLRVIARGSTLRYADKTTDLRTVGKGLGARYVMEGSLRQAGSALRVAVRLVDASTGAHLWAETYERIFRPEDIFALQDDLVPRIVSTVADWYGVLPHSISESLRSKDADQLSPYEAVLRSFGYYERMTAEEHAAARAGLERAVAQAPGNANCWAMLSMVYGEEYRYGFNAQPDPLCRSIQAARRAADAATSNHFAWLALAQALFYRKEFDAFRNAAERAIALNPMDGYTLARMGLSMAFLGDWEHGCELAERATQLNPSHPGWYWAASFNNAYRKGDYRGALSVTLKMNMPGLFFHHLNLAAVYGQLGEREAAGKALRELLVLKPDFALEARAEMGKFVNSELVEHLIDGLRKAGLEIARADGSAHTVAEGDATGSSGVTDVV